MHDVACPNGIELKNGFSINTELVSLASHLINVDNLMMGF